MIDHRTPEESKEWIGRVDPAGPERVTPRIELVGMLSLQDGLRLPVADLLPPIRLHRRPPMVPYDCRRTEADPPSAVQQAPADIDVVGCLGEDRAEAPDLLDAGFRDRRVAAGDVRSRPFIDHYLRRSAWGSVDTLGEPAILWRYQVGTSDADVLGFEVSRRQI